MTPVRFLSSRVTLGVRDVTLSVKFYTDVLGFQVQTTMGEPATFALLSAGDTGIALVRAAQPAVATFASVYFTVQGVEALLKRCEAAHAVIDVPLTRQPWGNYDFVVKDPDGHRLALGELAAVR